MSDFAKLILTILVVWLAFKMFGWILHAFGWIGVVVFGLICIAIAA